MPPYKPGQSGNPAGRPPKPRALAELLKIEGERARKVNGKKVTPNAELARILWESIVTGRVLLSDGRAMEFEPSEWLKAVRFLLQHLDGPARAELDLEVTTTEFRGPTVYLPEVIDDESYQWGQDGK